MVNPIKNRILVEINNNYKKQVMGKFFEVTVEVIVGALKNGKDKKVKEVFLVDAMTVTEAEAKVYKDYETTSGGMEFAVKSAKESRVLRVID